MPKSSGKWISDDRKRSEKEIADLVPYVAGSAIDAVRDALRRIVLENQDHSEVLDKLLPQLEQMPSKRSQALDWLDDELARLSDDEIITFTDRLKRVGGHELQLEPEAGASQPSDDPPAVEPQQPQAQPSRRPLWIMPAAMFVLAIVSFGAGRVWPNPIDVEALREELTRDMRAELEDTKVEISHLRELNAVLFEWQRTVLDPRVEGKSQWIENLTLLTQQADEMRRRLSDETKPQEGPKEKP